MKKEFLNFTGSSWGEFSNANGSYEIAQEITSPCESYAQAFEYLQANTQITAENAEGIYNSIRTLLGVENLVVNEPISQSDEYADVIYEDGIAPYEELPSAPNEPNYESYYEQQDNCNSFMNFNCWGENTQYSLNNPNMPEPIVYYNPEEVANTLASALLTLNDFLYDVVDGVVFLPEAPEDPMIVLGVIEELLERVLELEMECNNLTLVPIVVEQALGQMAEEYILFAFDNGFIEGDMTEEEFICMNEYAHPDSLSFIFELLNYTPSLCGGAEGCPDCPSCPDCGAPTDCPDCNCDCPDPCPQVGGMVIQGGKPPKPPKPPKPVKPIKAVAETIPKSRAPRNKSRFNGRKR